MAGEEREERCQWSANHQKVLTRARQFTMPGLDPNIKIRKLGSKDELKT